MKKLFDLLVNYRLTTLLAAATREATRIIWRQGVRNSYAQDYEDIEIEKIFKGKKGKYLEIGAYHPIRLSNTYRLYKKGWRGTVVEPNPEVQSLFKQVRPEDRYLNYGAGAKDGQLKYYNFLIPALNTFSKREADNNIRNGHKLKSVDYIKLISINKLVTEKIDFLSIDAEGMDFEILSSWPWQRCRPTAICVETDKNDPKIEILLNKQDYQKFFGNQFNTIFVWKKSRPEDGRRQ